MSQLPTETVSLNRGYVDQDGNAHTEVTLRAPTIHDDIESERICSDRDWNVEGTGGWMSLAKMCVVHWEGIPQPELKHFTALTRIDGTKLVKALGRLENKLGEVELGNAPSGEEGTPSPSVG